MWCISSSFLFSWNQEKNPLENDAKSFVWFDELKFTLKMKIKNRYKDKISSWIWICERVCGVNFVSLHLFTSKWFKSFILHILRHLICELLLKTLWQRLTVTLRGSISERLKIQFQHNFRDLTEKIITVEDIEHMKILFLVSSQTIFLVVRPKV